MKIKNKILLKKLEKAGLSDKESLIYITLLELGGAYPSKIAEYAGLNRSTVYMLLTQMSVKGIVNEIEKSKKQFYQLENPKKLLRYTKSKIILIEDELEKVEAIIPELDGLMYSVDKPKITYYEGSEGVIEIYTSHISVSKSYEMLSWVNIREAEEFLGTKFFNTYVKAKEKKKITSRTIFPDSVADKKFINTFYGGFVGKTKPGIRFIPSVIFPFKAEITIYGEKNVSIINLGKEKLTGVIIEDETIHGLMKMIFELSWAGAGIKSN